MLNWGCKLCILYRQGLHSSRGCSGHPPSSSPRSQKGSIGPVRIKPSHNNRETSPYASPPSASMLSNSMSTTTAGGFGSSGYSGRSSYAPSSYLSPPIDSSCRRFNSDSALNLNTLLIPSTVPDSSEDSSNNSNDYSATGLNCNRGPAHAPIAIANLSRTRDPHGSLLEIPPVPVSMSSTGSLPDLTNFQYPPPLQLPMDPDDQQNHSPYSTVWTAYPSKTCLTFLFFIYWVPYNVNQLRLRIWGKCMSLVYDCTGWMNEAETGRFSLVLLLSYWLL